MAKRKADQEVYEGDPTPPIKALPEVNPETNHSLPWYGPGYSYTPPKEGGGFWGGVLDVVTAPVKAVAAAGGAVVSAVETVASPVVNAAGAVLEVVRENPVAQVVAAAATGGLSLVAQAGIEAATGNGGPVLGFVNQLVNDPLEIVKAIPGAVLTESGLIGLVADGASAVGAATQEIFGDSTIGNLGGAIHSGVEDVQQAAEENPVASLQVIAGIALTAVGIPVGVGLISGGAGQLVNDAVASNATPQPTNPGIVPPAPAQLSLPTAPALSDAAASSSFLTRNWQVIAGAAATVAALGLVAWASQGEPSPA